ncbi:unnamed protein product [Phytophthora lilii]|uniref:Unnamed protein product n=1 Tax=Phytophthora lilii TaxID=2077276 RepID=A0A9W6WKP4_9STRA|nr:unnamed protein product [Phytophthora lilii]
MMNDSLSSTNLSPVAAVALANALLEQYGSPRYPTQPPQWASNLDTRLRQIQTQLGQQLELLQQLEEGQYQLGQQFQFLEVGQLQTNAALWNIRATAYNRECISMAARGQLEPFRRLKKSTPGFGNPLPQALKTRRSLPTAVVGSFIPSECFPVNAEELRNWSYEQISELSILINDDFGITAGDSLEECRLRVLEHIADRPRRSRPSSIKS